MKVQSIIIATILALLPLIQASGPNVLERRQSFRQRVENAARNAGINQDSAERVEGELRKRLPDRLKSYENQEKWRAAKEEGRAIYDKIKSKL